jgi:uncharacterized membrane-anchored protein YhcB (DUF1043 family)
MGIMMLAWLVIAVVVGLVAVRLVTRQLPSAPASDHDRRLAEQAEQIEQLEAELQRVKDQADFTEKLLTERSSSPPGDAQGEDSPD